MNPVDTSAHKYSVVVGVYSFIFAATTVSFLATLLTFRIIHVLPRKRRSEIPKSMWIYLGSMIILNLAMLQHSACMTIMWAVSSQFHYIGFYITGLIDHCLLPAIPASVFFLTFDRCLIVALKSSWTDKRRTILAAVNIIVMVILAVPNLVLPLLYRYYSVNPGCVAFACLQLNASRVTYTATKILTIVLNVIVGIAFLVLVYIFYRSHEGFSKHTSFSGKMGEQMILRILIFEALFDLIPHIVDMTWISVTGATPFVNFGPYSRVIVSVDNILTSVTNLYAFYVMYKKTRIVGMTASEIVTNIISGKDNGAHVVIVGGPGTSLHSNHCHYPVKK